MSSKLDPRKDEIFEAVKQGQLRSVSDIARAVDEPRPTVRDWWASLSKKPSFKTATIGKLDLDKVTSEPDEIASLKARLKETENALKRTAKTNELEYRALEMIEGIVTPEKLPAHLVPVTPADVSPGSYTGYLKSSDWHYGEVVDAEAMNGFNEFNTAIAAERVDRMTTAVFSHRAHLLGDLDHMIVELGGDMAGGANHLELDVTNEITVIEQGWDYAKLQTKQLKDLLDAGINLKVAAVVGNHPRLRKMPAHKQVYNNFDWLAYKTIQLRLAEYEAAGRIQFEIPRSTFHVTQVVGKNMLIWHGDGTATNMPGVPWGGVLRKFNSLRNQWMDQGIPIHYGSISHYHQWSVNSGGTLFMNGALKGPDEYSIKKFGHADPASQLFLVFSNKDQRVTGVHPIDLS